MAILLISLHEQRINLNSCIDWPVLSIYQAWLIVFAEILPQTTDNTMLSRCYQLQIMKGWREESSFSEFWGLHSLFRYWFLKEIHTAEFVLSRRTVSFRGSHIRWGLRPTEYPEIVAAHTKFISIFDPFRSCESCLHTVGLWPLRNNVLARSYRALSS